MKRHMIISRPTGRKMLCLVLALGLTASGSGCGGLYSDSHHWSQPFAYAISGDPREALEISNYSMLKSALIDLVSSHKERSTLRFSRYNGSPIDDLAAACLEIRTKNPLGAYAVSSLTCDTSRIVSYYVAEVQISYSRTQKEIQSIVGVSNMQELERRLREAVTARAESVALRVYSALVSELVISDLVEEIYLSDPVSVVCEPTVSVLSYPSEGINRIYDVSLGYDSDTETLAKRSRELSEEVQAAAELVRQTASEENAALMALESGRWLFAHVESPGEAADGGSAYDALVNAAAGSKGIALAYKALCSALGLDCLVVDGNIGDMGAERHYWNIVGLGGDWYHVDVSRFDGDLSQAFLLDDAGLWGAYLWNTERYPECAGPLRSSDFVPEETEGETVPEPEEDAAAEELPEDVPEDGDEFLPDTP